MDASARATLCVELEARIAQLESGGFEDKLVARALAEVVQALDKPLLDPVGLQLALERRSKLPNA